MNLSAGYTQLKKFMDYVNTYPERMNVENFSANSVLPPLRGLPDRISMFIYF